MRNFRKSEKQAEKAKPNLSRKLANSSLACSTDRLSTQYIHNR